MNGDLRFGLVGCGKISIKHAHEIAKHGTLAAVCDINKNKADKLAAGYAAKSYTSLPDLLKNESGNIDIITICTPNGLHASQSIKALEAGYHVLCEKPMSMDSADAERMIETARKSRRRLFVVKATRFNRVTLALKKLIESDSLGKIYSFQMNCFWNRPDEYYAKDEWRGTLNMDGGILYTQFSHYIDVLSWIFGEPKTISGFRQNVAHKKSIEFEDLGKASILMQNGVLGSISWNINAFQKNMEISLTIFAEKGTIKLGGVYLNTLEYEMPSGILKPDEAIHDDLANDYGFYKDSTSNHDKIYANLVKSLESEHDYIANGTDGWNAVRFIESIYHNCPIV